MTTAATCMQPAIGHDHRPTTRRRPHDVGDDAAGTVSGYARCIHCGAEVYVGRGAIDPSRMQRVEGEGLRAMRRRGD